jgi:hypothetical protein
MIREFRITRIGGDFHPPVALPLLEETLRIRTAKLGVTHPYTLGSMNNLALHYQELGRLSEALPLLEQAVRGLKESIGAQHHDTLTVMNTLVCAYLDSRKWAEAEKTVREGLAIREHKAPDEWDTFDTRSLLGGCLSGQKKYDAAEPLLVQGYEGMKARESKIPTPSKKALAHAGVRIVELYDAWGKKGKADEWRKKLGEKAPVEKSANP